MIIINCKYIFFLFSKQKVTFVTITKLQILPLGAKNACGSSMLGDTAALVSSLRDCFCALVKPPTSKITESSCFESYAES